MEERIDPGPFTTLLIELGYNPELREELEQERKEPGTRFTDRGLTDTQLEALRSGDPNAIFAGVQEEHGDAAEVAIWVGGLRPIMVPVMPPPPGS